VNGVKMEPKVSVIILNWNGWKDTVDCIKSLYKIDYPNYNIVVVDNASEDGSVEKIKDFYSEPLHWDPNLSPMGMDLKLLKFSKKGLKPLNDEKGLKSRNLKDKADYQDLNRSTVIIENDKNYGFAGGNNVGMRFSLDFLKSDYSLLLNNDTTVEKDFLSELVNEAQKHDDAGSFQSLLLSPDGKTIDSLGQELLSYRAHDKGMGCAYEGKMSVNEIFGPCAASALYKNTVLEEVGVFDEKFFVIFEDLDLSWRMRLKGQKSFLVPKSVVYHKRGISGEKASDRMGYYLSRNWMIILLMYYPLNGFLIKTILKTGLSFLKRGRFKEFLEVFIENVKIRRSTQKNPLLKVIQGEWIE